MEEVGNSMPLAESLVDAENTGSKNRLSSICLNCQAPLNGNYCSQCGQKNIPKRQTLGELIENFVGSFFSYESKFLRTIKYLLFKPGFLALEYNAGRRERYYHPARMYVFISFIYFFLFFALPDNEKRNDEIQSNERGKSSESADSSNSEFDFSLTTEKYKGRKEYDSVQATLPVEKRDGWIMRKMQYRAFELGSKYDENNQKFGREFGDSFAANTPKVLFFFLPVFALLLKLLYIRRDFYYSEHLVLSIYFYNFFFAAGILTLLLELIPFLDWISIVTVILVSAYLLIAMKKVYQQGWGKTVFKFTLLSTTFFMCLSFGLFVNLVFTLMFF